MRRPTSKVTFYRKFRKFLFLSVILFIINITTSPGNWWFIFPVLGMGIGIAARASRVDFSAAAVDSQQPASDELPREDSPDELDLESPTRQKKWSERDLV